MESTTLKYHLNISRRSSYGDIQHDLAVLILEAIVYQRKTPVAQWPVLSYEFFVRGVTPNNTHYNHFSLLLPLISQ